MWPYRINPSCIFVVSWTGIWVWKVLRVHRGSAFLIVPLNFLLVHTCHLKNWAGMLKGVGDRSGLNMELVRKWLAWLCLSVYHMVATAKYVFVTSSKSFFRIHLKLFCSSTFDTAASCLGEKQGVLVNNECSSWYNSIGDFVATFG